jgi:hypothetical protein
MKIEEYLNSIKPKEFIYILASIPIVIFIIYYNFIYPNMQEKHKKLIKQQKSIKKKLSNTVSEIRKIRTSLKILRPTKQKLEMLKEDYKFLQYSLDSIEILKLPNKKIYSLLEKLLNKSNELNLNISFKIDWNIENPIFTQVVKITITGSGNYVDIIKYLQYIEILKNLIIVNNKKISYKIDNKKSFKDVFIQNTKKSSLSLTLTKYSEKDLNDIKKLARNKNINLDISIDKENSNYLKITIQSSFSQIKSLVNFFNSKKRSKQIDFTNLRVKLNKPKQTFSKNTQSFKITFKVMGLK